MNKFFCFCFISLNLLGCSTSNLSYTKLNPYDYQLSKKLFLTAHIISLVSKEPPPKEIEKNTKKPFKTKVCQDDGFMIINSLLEKSHEQTKADYLYNVSFYMKYVQDPTKGIDACFICEGFYY